MGEEVSGGAFLPYRMVLILCETYNTVYICITHSKAGSIMSRPCLFRSQIGKGKYLNWILQLYHLLFCLL